MLVTTLVSPAARAAAVSSGSRGPSTPRQYSLWTAPGPATTLRLPPEVPLSPVLLLLSCYATPVDTGDTAVEPPPTLALDGPCSRYAGITLEGLQLRLTSEDPCGSCGLRTVLAPDHSGYRVQLERDDEVQITSWVCNGGTVSVRQVAYGTDGLDVDVYDPPADRWIGSTPLGGSWTTTSEITRVREGELQDVVTRRWSYTLEAEETLDLRPGDFPAIRVRDTETGELRWVSEGFGIVQVQDEDGTAKLTSLRWPGEDTGG